MSRRAPHPRALGLLAAAIVAVGATRAGAQAPPQPAGMSPLEQGVAFSAAAAGIFLLAAGNTVFDPPAPSMGAPAPNSLDARLSRWLYRPGGGRLLAGVPDVLGISLIPALPALAYGYGWLTGNATAGQRLMAYVEAAGWTFLTTGTIKYLVGRPRPYLPISNNHPELRHRVSEDNLSFFSGHSSSCFALATFATADFARYLRRTRLAQGGTAARVLWGWVFPYALGYGVPALVAVSRIIDQQHWPSDVLVGGLVGGLIGSLGYAAHFDSEGEPRVRPVSMLPVPLVGPVNSDGRGGRTVQLALVGRL
jgi:membrane-associated phospholipid phosphatase